MVLLEKSEELVKSNNKQMRLSCAKGINKMLCHSEEGVVGDLSILDGEAWVYRIIPANAVDYLLSRYFFYLTNTLKNL